MRFAIPLLAALALVASAGCGGGDGTAQEEPAALEQRIVTEADAPGSKPDPVEKRQMTLDFDEFIDVLGEVAIDPDTEEMTDVSRKPASRARSSTRVSSARRTVPALLTSFRR